MMNFVKKHPLLTAFLIPFFICIIICIGNGVYPFGDYCLCIWICITSICLF